MEIVSKRKNVNRRQLSESSINKIAADLIKGWKQEHGNNEESARLFWQTLTRKLYNQGSEAAVQTAIETLRSKGNIDNAKVMENELEKLLRG